MHKAYDCMQKGYIMLEKILSSQIRSRIFTILFDSRLRSFHMREIERLTDMAIGTVQRELRKLDNLDLIKKTVDGNRNYFQANDSHPIYEDLCNIVRKTDGIEIKLKSELTGFKSIQLAFIFGSYAMNNVKSQSDIDLFIIGSIGLRDIISPLKKIQEEISREVNPHIFPRTEFRNKYIHGDHFLTNLKKSEKVFIIGTEDEFRKLVEE